MAFNVGGGNIANAGDVSFNSLSSADFMGYDGVTSKWTNKTVVVPANTSDLVNDGALGDGAAFAMIKGAARLEVVTVLPATPDPSTLYFVTGN